MDNYDAIKEYSHEWSVERWYSNKDRIKDCIAVEGAILKHEKEDFVYFSPEPTEWSVVFEIKKDAIVEVFPTKETRSKEGVEYNIVRLYIKQNTLLLRLETFSAEDLTSFISYLNSLTRFNKVAEQSISMFVAGASNGDKEPGLSPSSSPSDRGGSRGGAASGVRG